MRDPIPLPVRRRTIRAGFTALAALALAVGMTAAYSAASAARLPAGGGTVVNPYSPAYGHAYRHGVVPMRGTFAKMRAWSAAHNQAPQASANDLNYGGGIDGIGVTTGPEKVYLVFWGSQWGTTSTDGNGNTTFSNDPNHAAPYYQQYMKGLGTGGELWSGVMTQYCDGVAVGAQSCPSGSAQVGYPTGGALAGVWADNSTSSPSAATPQQLGTEAVNAAAHFGNTSSSLNRDAQYVILSPTGANPDNYQTGGFCAWHDWNGDSFIGVSSPYGDIAFTNMPYVTDVGASCGEGFVNSPGVLDGFSIVGGHEYAETITDQNPAGGWTDSSGAENGDKCAWITPGTSGGSFDLSLTTGTFAVQTTWANDGAGGAGSCEGSHAIVGGGGGGNTVTVNNPGNQTSTVGTPVSLQISATDSAGGQTLTYSASGLPNGLSINSSTGLISGTPSTANTYSTTVTATDTTGAHGSASFTWTVNSSGSGNAITNGGFETGSLSGWTSSGAITGVTSSGPHSGSWAAILGSTTTPTNGNSSIAQTFTANSGNTHLTFWYDVLCPDTVTFDWATATLRDNTAGTSRTVLGKTCNNNNVWVQVSATITAGHSYTLTLTSRDDNYFADPTATKYDDVATS